MKKLFFIPVVIFLINSCDQVDKNAKEGNSDSITATTTGAAENIESDPTNITTIEWLDTKERDMGKIIEGQKLEVSFRFKNTGTKPLLISKVWAQCGCTVPETPKEPYAPGQEGVIKASFDSQGRGGSLNTKEVYVNANTDPVTNVLVFTVDVKKKG